jgi:hypothetical protein
VVASKTKNGGFAIDEPPQGSMNDPPVYHGAIRSVSEYHYYSFVMLLFIFRYFCSIIVCDRYGVSSEMLLVTSDC